MRISREPMSELSGQGPAPPTPTAPPPAPAHGGQDFSTGLGGGRTDTSATPPPHTEVCACSAPDHGWPESLYSRSGRSHAWARAPCTRTVDSGTRTVDSAGSPTQAELMPSQHEFVLALQRLAKALRASGWGRGTELKDAPHPKEEQQTLLVTSESPDDWWPRPCAGREKPSESQARDGESSQVKGDKRPSWDHQKLRELIATRPTLKGYCLGNRDGMVNRNLGL